MVPQGLSRIRCALIPMELKTPSVAGATSALVLMAQPSAYPGA